VHHPASSKRKEHVAVAALLLGTVFWGCGFTWAKAAGEAVQDAAGLPRHSSFGPIFLLAWRFLFAAIVWFAIFPASRRGWTRRSFGWGVLVGAFLAGGLLVQHLGLDLSSEAVSAFLTSLTILFVPLIMLLVFRKPPRAVLWLGVVLATVGVWLMTGAQPQGFGKGEALGLACAFMFTLYILAVNAASRTQSPWQMVGAQFVSVAIACFVASAFVEGGRNNLQPGRMMHVLSVRAVWLNLALLTVFTTLLAFGLLTFFQPQIDPTRAALTYLAEPIFATAYAAIFAGHAANRLTLVGAALILIANLLVELLSSPTPAQPEQNVVLVD
jgi:drug/metabolite transporter (DMT)-like permease